MHITKGHNKMTYKNDGEHTLSLLYKNLNYDLDNSVKMYHSSIHYVKFALQQKQFFIYPEKVPTDEIRETNVTLKQIYKILYEEGLLPYTEYGIPYSYAKKYFKECSRKERDAFNEKTKKEIQKSEKRVSKNGI